MTTTEAQTQAAAAVRLLATCRLAPTGQSLEVLLFARAEGGPRIVLDATGRDQVRAEAAADPAMLHELAAALTGLVAQISDVDEAGHTFLDFEQTDDDEPEQAVRLQLLHGSVLELALLLQDVYEDGPDEAPSEFATGPAADAHLRLHRRRRHHRPRSRRGPPAARRRDRDRRPHTHHH